MNAHVAANALRSLRSFRAVPGLQLVQVPDGQVGAATAAYRRNPNILYAEPDYLVQADVIPNDPDFLLLWGLRNTGQEINGDSGTAGADIRATSAWDLWVGDPDFRIAVIDTGVDYLHPDLAANIWTNPGEIPGNNIDDDGNGWIDDVHGYDFINSDGDPRDDAGHGTHVAGTIGGVGNNGVGVTGVNWRCKIVALKFLGSGGLGATSGAIGALQYVIDNNIRLSNNSWGGGAYSQALYDMLAASQAVGHVFVAAAGNSATDNDASPHYPSSYDLPNVIAVAATDNDDQLASFSNWGRARVDLGAPGVRIYSTVPNNGYTFLSGTSMASPHVTGVFGLLMSRSPQLSWQDARDRVLDGVRPVLTLTGLTVTGGVLNAVATLGDCNTNGIDDAIDISGGSSADCTGNGVPDECEPDCNTNAIADSCDIASGFSTDCDGQGWPDECQPDCNTNNVADPCDIAGGVSDDCNFNLIPDECEPAGTEDCNGNGRPDLCDLFDGLEADCNLNLIPDSCDVNTGASDDCTGNGVPDECEPDCNANAIADSCDIASGFSTDCDGQGWPDECQPDCNTNNVADPCDIAGGVSGDCNFNLIPDECEPAGTEDCNGNGRPDLCDLFDGTVGDCNLNLVPDSCDVTTGASADCNENGTPDECETALQILLTGDASLEFAQSLRDLGHYITRTTRGSRAIPTDLSPFDVLVFGPGGVPPPDPFVVERLDEFVHAGGGVIRIQDPPQATFQYYGLASPVTQAVGWTLRSGTQVADTTSPIVSGLPTTSSLTGYSAVYTLRPDALVVKTWNDGEPMTVAYRYGAGRVVYFNDLWAAYPDIWEGDLSYGLTLMDQTLRYVRAPDHDCNTNHVPDDCDILSGTSEDCTGNGVPDECEPDCNENSVPDSCDILSGTSSDFDGNGVPDECDLTLYVDHDATGAGTGLTWTDAFTDLQSALDAAAQVAAADVDTQIWVAAGVYRPSTRTDLVDPRSATFWVLDFVKIYGGFAGGEARLSDRDVRNHVTVLSGDLAADDGPNFTANAENAYHVITGSERTPSAVLDGFTITGGNAYEGQEPDWRLYGGGLFVFDGSPTFINCTVIANRSFDGAGMWLIGNSFIINSTFAGNRAGRRGGGIHMSSDSRIVNCVFTGNTAGDDPGYYGSGAGVEVRGSGDPAFVNCTFSRNATAPDANSAGGGLSLNGFINATVHNCIFWGNSATQASQISVSLSAVVDITHSDIQGWTQGGVGNLNVDPRFVDSDGLDNIVGTADDNLRLLSSSSCIDAGDNAAVPGDVADLNRNLNTSEPTPLDRDGAPRFFDDPAAGDTGSGVPPIVDVGAYEHGDCNGNGIPDLFDVSDGASADCNDNGVPDECENDCNENGLEDACDVAGGTSQDCNDNLRPDECETDSDQDGTINACDGCPFDPAKLLPGICGCGASDADSDGDGVIDCEDRCAGFDDGLDTDGDAVPDGCERCPGYDDSLDCNANSAPDGCDILGGTSLDLDGSGIPDECEWAPEPVPDPAGANTRSMSLSVPPPASATGSAIATAIRVTMLDLQNPIPPNEACCPPPDFSAFESDTCTASGEANGCARWVGKPGTFLESQDNPTGAANRAARLQCTPFYYDWITETTGGPIAVVGAEVAPSSEYSVQTYAASCKGAETGCANVSTAVTMYTRRSGDIAARFNPPDPSTQPDAIDVTQLVSKFKNVVGAPSKAIAQLQPNLPELNADINALDIVAVVDAVKQFAYAFSGPCACPSAVTCGPAVGSVACTTQTPCVTAFGAGASCVKTCSGGDNDGDPCINNTHCPGVGGTCGNGFCRDRCGRCTP